MTDPSTAAYYKALEAIPENVRAPIDLEAIDAIDLDAICPHSRPGSPNDHSKPAWNSEELLRWYVEGRISAARRRAGGRAKGDGER